MLLIEPGNDDFHDDRGRGLIRMGQITAAVEIVLVNSLGTSQTVGTDGELNGFEDGRFTDVVVAKKYGRTFEMKVGKPYPPEILDMNADNSH